MGKRIWTFLAILVLFSFSLSGCIYFSATKEMKSAEQLISELKAAGGPTLVPYEYTSAEKLLENAKLEASDNDWTHAKGFAIRSKAAAEAGLAQVKKK
jgi:cytochrome c biogenesis protein ResB